MFEKNTPGSAEELAQELRCTYPGCRCGKREGKGWIAHCPAHDDRNPSLSLTDAVGKLLIHCFAGCSQQDVIQALVGRGLWPGHGVPHGRPAAYQGEPVLTWCDYRDANGELLYAVGRTASKQFPIARPDGIGGWTWRLGNQRRILYRLSEFYPEDSGRAVFVVEGEKDADRLAGLGVLATTNPGGALKWGLVDQEPLRGRTVVIIPDNDEPGRRHAREVARSLGGVAGRVITLDPLPGVGPGGDVSDFLDTGHTIKQLKEMVQTAARSQTAMKRETDAGPDGRVAKDGPIIIDATDIEPVEVSWLWDRYVPRGKIALIAGDPNVGKSWLVLAIAASVTKGVSLEDAVNPGWSPARSNKMSPNPGDVLILTAEDGLADTVIPRLKGMGADLQHVKLLRAIRKGDRELHPSLDRDLPGIEEALKEADYKLLVIDPFNAYTGGNIDTNKDSSVREILTPLGLLAERRGIAVIVILHLNKGGHDKGIYRFLGSIGFVAAARVAFLVARNPKDDRERVLAPIKNNLAPDMPPIAFEISDDGRFSWRGETSVTADDLLTAKPHAEDGSELEEAKRFIQEVLAKGAVKVKDIFREASNAGISIPTLKRAKVALGVKSARRQEAMGGANGYWEWFLPDRGWQQDHAALSQSLIPFSRNKPRPAPNQGWPARPPSAQGDQDQQSDASISLPADERESSPTDNSSGKRCRKCGGPNEGWDFPYCRPCQQEIVRHMDETGE